MSHRRLRTRASSSTTKTLGLRSSFIGPLHSTGVVRTRASATIPVRNAAPGESCERGLAARTPPADAHLEPLDDSGDSLAEADAHRLEPVARRAPLELVEQRR